MKTTIFGIKKSIIFTLLVIFINLLFFSACNKSEKRSDLKSGNLIHDIDMDSGTFLSISDIHFNPFFDPSLVDDLVTSDINSWDSIFKSTKISGYGEFDKGTNYSLLQSSLDQMIRVAQNPDYIIISGSMLINKFGINFQKHTESYERIELDAFIKKTLQFVLTKLQNKFPNIMILPVLGNNESCCGEYTIKPNSSYLKIITDLWLPIVDKSTDPNLFKKNVERGGFYSIYTPGNNKHKIIVLNSTFFSINYHRGKGQDIFGQRISQNTLQGVVNKQFSWLKNELSKSRETGEKVWLIYHSPPGINVTRTLNGKNNCEKNVKTFWKNLVTNLFLNIIKEYSSVITANLAAHSHFSNFNLILDNNEKPVSFIHITNSLAPISGNNPGFQVVQYNKKLNMITDFTTYFFKGLSTFDTAQWERGGDFNETFGIDTFSQNSLNSIYMQLEADTSLRSKYIDFYNTSNINDENWKAYWCATGRVSQSGFIDCYCKE